MYSIYEFCYLHITKRNYKFKSHIDRELYYTTPRRRSYKKPAFENCLNEIKFDIQYIFLSRLLYEKIFKKTPRQF